MEKKFWHDRWRENDIAFHLDQPNPKLVDNFKKLSIKENSCIFVPLCGKTLDISWLLSNGYKVAGIELSETAIIELFKTLAIEPIIKSAQNLKHYSANNIDIFVGDFFDLSKDKIPHIHAIYDRGAYVALPESLRTNYCKHIVKLTNKAPQLLVTYEYDQTLMKGPPFSINHQNLMNNYAEVYEIANISSENVEGGLKGKCIAKETVWILNKKKNCT